MSMLAEAPQKIAMRLNWRQACVPEGYPIK